MRAPQNARLRDLQRCTEERAVMPPVICILCLQAREILTGTCPRAAAAAAKNRPIVSPFTKEMAGTGLSSVNPGEVTVMTGTWRSRRTFAFTIALALLTALVAVVLAYPNPVAVPAPLGGGWECRATAFSTICSPARHAEPAAHRVRTGPICLRRV